MAQGQLDIRENGIAALGDTMNGGSIFVHGDAGEAAGYAMWGGALYIRGSAADRAGIHMKTGATLLIGGSAGDYLGEYQAGGTMILLGLDTDGPLYGQSPWAGMHGGQVYLRRSIEQLTLPIHVSARAADAADIQLIMPHLECCAQHFEWNLEEILQSPFTVLTPKTHQPYKTMYTPI